jgi:hypothetical protein
MDVGNSQIFYYWTGRIVPMQEILNWPMEFNGKTLEADGVITR